MQKREKRSSNLYEKGLLLSQKCHFIDIKICLMFFINCSASWLIKPPPNTVVFDEQMYSGVAYRSVFNWNIQTEIHLGVYQNYLKKLCKENLTAEIVSKYCWVLNWKMKMISSNQHNSVETRLQWSLLLFNLYYWNSSREVNVSC